LSLVRHELENQGKDTGKMYDLLGLALLGLQLVDVFGVGVKWLLQMALL